MWQLLSGLFTHQSSEIYGAIPDKGSFLSRGAWGISEAVKDILKFRKRPMGLFSCLTIL